MARTVYQIGMRSFAALLAAVMVLATSVGTPARAGSDHVVTVGPSAHDVATTIDRLEALLKSKGISIMARVDHAAGAAKAGLELAPTTLLIFGNPKLGTPLMHSNRLVALDLPMKALAWSNETGKVWLSYTAPGALASRYDVKDRSGIVAKMTGALKAFTTKAIAAE